MMIPHQTLGVRHSGIDTKARAGVSPSIFNPFKPRCIPFCFCVKEEGCPCCYSLADIFSPKFRL